MSQEHRCKRGQKCPLVEPVRDPAGNHTGAWNAPLLTHRDEVFCPACRGQLQSALLELPDLVTTRSIIKPVNWEIRYKDSDVVIPKAPFGPVPIDLEADAIVRYVDHELDAWAEMLSDSCGVAWDSKLAAGLPRYARMRDACRTLDYGINHWLTMRPQTYRARSLGVGRGEGHPEEKLTYDGHDLWTTRDGKTAASIIIGLHERAERLDGPPASDRLPIPCWVKACGARTVYRLHFLRRVQCSTCKATRSDDSYDYYRDEFLTAALARKQLVTAEGAA